MKKKWIIIPAVVICAIVALTILGVNLAGDYAINALINSVGDEALGALEKLQSPTPAPTVPDGAQPTASDEGQQDTPEATTAPDTPAIPSTDKIKNIEYGDKMDALTLIQSKFSASEIAYYTQKVSEGKISEIMGEVKQKLKARCSEAEIAQVREWYEKYK